MFGKTFRKSIHGQDKLVSFLPEHQIPKGFRTLPFNGHQVSVGWLASVQPKTSRPRRFSRASSRWPLLDMIQYVLTRSAPSSTTGVSRSPLEIRPNSIGSRGPSVCQLPSVDRFPESQSSDPQPRIAICMAGSDPVVILAPDS